MATGSWGRLTRTLQESDAAQVVMTFEQIERVIGGTLPASARRHAAFWSNSSSYAKAWRAAGYELTRRGLLPEQVRFVRVRPSVRVVTTAPQSPSQTDVLLVGCVKSKRDVPSPAKDLYVSPLFTRRRSYAEGTHVPWFVLSAEHGLVDPETVISPYDLALADQSPEYRSAWGQWVVARLRLVVGELAGSVVELHAGDAYVRALHDPLRNAGAVLRTPVDGMRLGEQLEWYDRVTPLSAASCRAFLDENHSADPRRIADFLGDPTNAVPAERLRPEALPQTPGLYAWFVDEAGAVALSGALGEEVQPGLIYAGQAGATRWPNGSVSGGTLRSRVLGMHLHGRVAVSTFRQTLVAALGAETAAARDESWLTRWMLEHLSVTAVPVRDGARLAAIEADVLELLRPPFNLSGMESTTLREALAEARRGTSARLAKPSPESARHAVTLVSDEALHAAIDRRLRTHGNWGMSQQEWRNLCRMLVDRMEQWARDGTGDDYSALVQGTSLEHRPAWHFTIADVLGVIAEAVHRCGLPMLTAVVWGKGTGSPGAGFNAAARHLGRQRAGEDDLTVWVRELREVHRRWSRAPG